MGLNDSFLLRDLDKTLAIAGVILSLVLIIYMGQEIGRVVYQLAGVLALGSCLLWLLIRKNNPIEFHLPESRAMTTFWEICFFGLYTLSVLSLHFRPNLYERPLLYFILMVFMAGFIACEIFMSGRRHAGLILIQIMLLGVSIAWSQLLIFPGLIGVDPMYHFAFTNEILDKGYIPDGFVYSKLPLFHLLVATTSLVTGFTYKFAAMVSVSLGQVICNVVFVFLIANRLFKNHRVGLLATLLVIISNYHIFMSYWSIPNAFAAIFIPIALYLIFFRLRGSSPFPSVLLCIMVLATIILTHTITAMCMAIILFVAWSALAIYWWVYHSRVENNISLSVPIVFITAMFAWWTYASEGVVILGNFIKLGFISDIFTSTPVQFQNYAVAAPLGEQLFNNFGVFLFFIFSFTGIFYMISRKGSDLTFALAWVGMAPLAFGFFSLITGHPDIEARWWFYAQILLSIPLAVAIYTIGTLKIRKPILFYCFVFGFVVVLSFFMIMSPPANTDNSMFSPNSNWRAAPIESELQARTILDHYYGIIKSDSFFAYYLGYLGYNIKSFDKEIGDQNILRMKGDLILIRDTILTGPLMFFTNTYEPDYIQDDLINAAGFNRVYDSGSVFAYQ
ncbi:hypothetical protein [Methanosphaerula subterraneus]|uniref:hypothetical protein n=1 Tax=Methanosphaerula subterraneus TaxID=3350244 RepID=UPI003F87BFEA